MITVPSPYPTDAALAGLLDGQLRRPFHNQMPQRVFAVDEGRTSSGAQYPNVGPRINSAALGLVHVLLQPEHTMGVRAARVGFRHQIGHLSGIRWGNFDGHKRSRDEPLELSYSNACVAQPGLGSFAHNHTFNSAIIWLRKTAGTLYTGPLAGQTM